MHLLFERRCDENRYICSFWRVSRKSFIWVYMILGDTVLKLETFVWILNHISRSITWSLFILIASFLVKWPISTSSLRITRHDYSAELQTTTQTNLNMIFHVVVSVYRLVKIWNSPQFPDEFRNGQLLSSSINAFTLFKPCYSWPSIADHSALSKKIYRLLI